MPTPSPSATIPGVTDTLDFVKNLWGSMSIPGAGMGGMPGITGPAMSVEDLDKRIADMKAVEAWLNLNLSMLRGTIQTMEVQRSTLATLKSMGASMAEAMRQSGVSADKMANMPFAPFFGQPGPSTPASGASSAKPAGGGSGQPGAASAPDALPGADMGMPAAVAWWNMLQEQFTQAVTTAMRSGPAGETTEVEAKAKQNDMPPQHNQVTPQSTPETSSGKPRTGKPRTDKT